YLLYIGACVSMTRLALPMERATVPGSQITTNELTPMYDLIVCCDIVNKRVQVARPLFVRAVQHVGTVQDDRGDAALDLRVHGVQLRAALSSQAHLTSK